MTAPKKEALTKWLLGFAWSVALVVGTAIFAAGGRWKDVQDNTCGVKEIRTEVAAVRDRVTKLESDLGNIAANQREIKQIMRESDQARKAEYKDLLDAIQARER